VGDKMKKITRGLAISILTPFMFLGVVVSYCLSDKWENPIKLVKKL